MRFRPVTRLTCSLSTFALRARALTLGGSAAAAVVGSICFAAGPSWAVLLLAFFLTSTLLSKVGPRERLDLAAKVGPRDAAQVLANGLVPTVAAACHVLHLRGPWTLVYAESLEP
jgi:uncharacterized membrane protein